MRIVSYNVNGLRARVLQHKFLKALLDALNADIICLQALGDLDHLQETKISRQEISADLAVAEGYESFFSFAKGSRKGRVGYSGVATFCRTPSWVPIAAEEGFSGLLNPRGDGGGGGASLGLEGVSEEEMVRMDGEGRCLVTDHRDFVLYNLYAPCVAPSDDERMRFKLTFYRRLEARWRALMGAGRRVIAVGDFNIAPALIDTCKPGSNFDASPCRQWLRGMLSQHPPLTMWDTFRVLHPDRSESFTCWSQASGAEEFNYGTRIDLVLMGGGCRHRGGEEEGEGEEKVHGFGLCDLAEAGVMREFMRSKGDSLLSLCRWSGGRSGRLEGSDHAPVFVRLTCHPDWDGDGPTPPIPVPPLAARFMPELRGRQQTLVRLFPPQPSLVLGGDPSVSALNPNAERKGGGGFEYVYTSGGGKEGAEAGVGGRGRGTKHRRGSASPSRQQKKLMSFFPTKTLKASAGREGDVSRPQDADISTPTTRGNELRHGGEASTNSPAAVSGLAHLSSRNDVTGANDDVRNPHIGVISGQNGVTHPEAARDWMRIRASMAAATPLCKGHREACVFRVVKKGGPNSGRGFYVCARAQGPSSNLEARCDHFEWSSGKGRSCHSSAIDVR